MSTTSNPPFENLFLKSIADALARRRKAIRYHLKALTLDRSIDEADGISFERLDLNLKCAVPHATSLQFVAWEDSRSWICLLQHQKKVGWTFKLELRPDLWDFDGPEIVRRIEATVARLPSKVAPLTTDAEESIRAIWISKQDSSSAPRKKKRK
jgi:hypothetical protein